MITDMLSTVNVTNWEDTLGITKGASFELKPKF